MSYFKIHTASTTARFWKQVIDFQNNHQLSLLRVLFCFSSMNKYPFISLKCICIQIHDIIDHTIFFVVWSHVYESLNMSLWCRRHVYQTPHCTDKYKMIKTYARPFLWTFQELPSGININLHSQMYIHGNPWDPDDPRPYKPLQELWIKFNDY